MAYSCSLCFFRSLLKTIIYIDGFNLYYGCLKGTPYKWLNLLELSKLLLPKHEILKIKYFTAKVSPQRYNLDCHKRQYTYIRALQSLDCCEIYYGFYLSNVKNVPLAKPTNKGRFIDIIHTEEKGFDVNLATHLLLDGFKNRYDSAVVVSNDSDFATTIQAVKDDLKKNIGVISPYRKPARALQNKATFYKKIRSGVLQAAQFPVTITLKNGKVIHKPSEW